ncbi:MAG: hypothetical protein HYT88_00375 [Candidatus Omnitrophica bacterium]|nr:hypothetical protein [Candidatus Omnitrophota bacterium]MBI2174518.1 hypothetical protein [Candidatus Omnitrophota bacterium]MBI3009435.1 hypothetical protein [Candidatus Omnitrophota bacterium]
MNKRLLIIASVLGITLVGALAAEHTYCNMVERRYAQLETTQQTIHHQVGKILQAHQQARHELQEEQQRSQKLSEALTLAQSKLEEMTTRATEEARSVQDLQLRLAGVHEQMSQLQGELASVLRERQTSKNASSTVQLDRIIVSQEGAPELQGRVLSVDRQWKFIVVDLGWDAVRIGDVVSIFRNGKLLAKARIERVQEGISAASFLPDWEHAEVETNDLVKLL